MYYDEEYKNTTFSCPKALLKRVKKQCLENDVTLKDTIIQLLRNWVAEQERREGR